jgi:hypothetical protein
MRGCERGKRKKESGDGLFNLLPSLAFTEDRYRVT